MNNVAQVPKVEAFLPCQSKFVFVALIHIGYVKADWIEQSKLINFNFGFIREAMAMVILQEPVLWTIGHFEVSETTSSARYYVPNNNNFFDCVFFKFIHIALKKTNHHNLGIISKLAMSYKFSVEFDLRAVWNLKFIFCVFILNYSFHFGLMRQNFRSYTGSEMREKQNIFCFCGCCFDRELVRSVIYSKTSNNDKIVMAIWMR